MLGIEPLSADEILFLLDQSKPFQEIQRHPLKKLATLRGKTVALAFFEPSTRTRISFATAAARLGADQMNLQAESSSLKKGESLLDTVRTLDAMKPDCIVMRHSSSGAPDYVARNLDLPVINAGDGTHEHPTQALLDAFTIRRHKGRLGGLKVAIVGDLLHSRVLRSNVRLLTKLGAEVWVSGPPTLVPVGIERFGVRVSANVDEAVAGADVIMMLRIQQERMNGAFIPSLREYFNTFGMTAARVAKAKPDVIIMHPGPMNRGVEIASDVADGPYSVILEQVANGVAVRMAVLWSLLGSGGFVV
jgi:aspartate carbamoyltransferase catalytic subunit